MNRSDIEVKAVGPYLRVLSGFPFPSAGFREDGAGVPLIRIRDLLPGRTETTFVGSYDPAYLVRAGETLIGMDGDFNCVDWPGTPALLNQRVCKVTANGQELNQRFLRHWLPAKLEEIHRKTPQTTVRHLSTYDIEAISIPFFPRSEQTRIAEVLDILDEAICLMEAEIEKREQARLALIYDLLRYGIDENGSVRTFGCSGFQDTSLGLVPATWTVAPFDHFSSPERPVIKTGPFGSTLKGTDWTDTGVPVITIGALGEGEVDPSQLLYVSEEKARRLSAYVVQEGDLLFSRVADVGRSIVVSTRESGWIMSSNLMWISLDQTQVDPLFAWLSLTKSPTIRSQIRKALNAGGREVANGPILRSLLIAWPELDEQRRIVATEQGARAGIQAVMAELAKLYALKSGLTSDLLTGRVRTVHT